MTTSDFNSNEQEVDNNPIFQTFNWHRKEIEDINVHGSQLARLAGQVRDISSGCEAILELVEFDHLQVAAGEQRLFNDYVEGNLMRLAIQSLRLLNQQADNTLTSMYDHCTKADKGD